MNTEFTAYSADCTGNASNCLYPNEIRVDGLEAFQKLVMYDHVFAEFKNNYRSMENFLRAQSLPGISTTATRTSLKIGFTRKISRRSSRESSITFTTAAITRSKKAANHRGPDFM